MQVLIHPYRLCNLLQLLIRQFHILLYALPDKRWARDIRYIFDGIFITLSEEIGADIMEISEDGALTWDREGDAVLPVDKKLRAKMAKEGKSFTDFDSYDN